MLVSNGISIYHTWAHMKKAIMEKGFDVSLHDVSEQIGILSVQGPNRYGNIYIFIIQTPVYKLMHLLIVEK